MKILIGEEVATITGCKHKKQQIKWFEQEGITCRMNALKQVYTTDDWMNGKDKYQAQNDDGFNIGAIA
jgi:hypothetical protein